MEPYKKELVGTWDQEEIKRLKARLQEAEKEFLEKEVVWLRRNKAIGKERRELEKEVERLKKETGKYLKQRDSFEEKATHLERVLSTYKSGENFIRVPKVLSEDDLKAVKKIRESTWNNKTKWRLTIEHFTPKKDQ